MPKTKVAVTIDAELLGRLDALIAKRRFPSRSQAIETAVEEKLARLKRARLAIECAKLDPKVEKAIAEEGLGQDVEAWPEF
jgi:Arc/MetJ-type ribon-helix-helix transcriptional regulator